MAKWRNSALVIFATLSLVNARAQAQVAPDEITSSIEDVATTTDDVASPAEMAADEPADRPQLAAPDADADLSCPARMMIFIDKSQSAAPSSDPLFNLKPASDRSQTMQVYVDCKLKYNWPVSTGRERNEVATSGTHYFSDTPAGNYRFDWRTTAYHSHLWNAPMPFAQFFLPGIAIHATEPSEYHKLGHRASGACVRLHLQNAKTLYNEVTKIGAQNVLINITDGQPFHF